MLGRKLTASEALERRLVAAVFGPSVAGEAASDEFRREATVRAQALAALPATSLRVCKKVPSRHARSCDCIAQIFDCLCFSCFS